MPLDGGGLEGDVDVACGRCGASRRAKLRGNFRDLKSDGASRITLAGDAADCELYHGVFSRSAQFYVVGAHTPHERLFLRQNMVDAVAYANENGKLSISQLVQGTSLCHDRVVAVIGA